MLMNKPNTTRKAKFSRRISRRKFSRHISLKHVTEIGTDLDPQRSGSEFGYIFRIRV